MRCKKIEKWISDGIDGRLSAEKRTILESHIAACASCRAYREHLENIQKESQGLLRPQPAPGYWQESISRLKAGLRAAQGAGTKVKEIPSPSFLFKWKWAWAGAAALLVVALGLYFILSSPKARPEMMAVFLDDAIAGIDQEIGDNPELEKYLNSVLQDSIYENIGEINEAANPFHYENPLFLESLTEEELLALDSAIQAALKL
jgi:hypothetical protein